MGKHVDPNLINVEEAASRVGMTRDSFVHCLIQDKFPFKVGIVIRKPGNKNNTYYIYRRKIEALEQYWNLVD